MTFDFPALALGLGTVSLFLAGAIMGGAALFPEMAEKAKRTWIPTTITGLVIVGVATFILGFLGS